MIKLQDFARQMGVSDRAIQKHLKNHESELEGHFERKGTNGTWLDDFAQNFIRERMKQQPVVVYDDSASELMDVNKRLEVENKELQKKLIEVYELLTAAKEQQIKIQQDLSEQKLLAAKAEAAELALTDARERLKTVEDVADLNAQERDRERQRAETAEAEADKIRTELDYLRNRGFWARVFNK